jgi:hypothetical protein
MAVRKSDTFFIRSKVTTSDTTFQSTTIDLGAFVDALGQSVLRIHSIAVQFLANGTDFPWGAQAAVANAAEALGWNLTTQLQTELVDFTDKSLIASGYLTVAADNSTPTVTLIDETEDVNPSRWKNGYLVATESIFLGVDSLSAINPECDVCIMMECTVEKLSKEAALALALSQQ